MSLIRDYFNKTVKYKSEHGDRTLVLMQVGAFYEVYGLKDKDTGEIIDPKVREKDTLNKKFWDPIFKETDFKEFVKSYYSIGHKPLLDIDLDIPMEE